MAREQTGQASVQKGKLHAASLIVIWSMIRLAAFSCVMFCPGMGRQGICELVCSHSSSLISQPAVSTSAGSSCFFLRASLLLKCCLFWFKRPHPSYPPGTLIPQDSAQELPSEWSLHTHMHTRMSHLPGTWTLTHTTHSCTNHTLKHTPTYTHLTQPHHHRKARHPFLSASSASWHTLIVTHIIHFKQ